jgi:micrococcal nuclease
MILLATALCAPLVVTDGDTFVCNNERIRILGLDAPETYFAKCDAEYRLGIVAKRRLQELVTGANLEIRRNGKDRYDRTLAQVIADGTDVAEPMISEGLARLCKSAGCRKSWCETK